MPKVEFAFEARVSLAPAVVLGETSVGHRQFIPITGGPVSGPLFKGEVMPGGWDYQLRTAGGCNSLTADYFWRAADGTVIHILNAGLMCPGGPRRAHMADDALERRGPTRWIRAQHSWRAGIERPAGAPAAGPAPLSGIRLKFYQIK